MPDKNKSSVLVKLAVRHLVLALRLLQRLNPRPTPDIKGGALPALATVPLEHPVSLLPEGSDNPLDSLLSLVRRRMIDQLRDGDFFTNDVVEIRGRIGSKDNRDLKINGRPSFKLDRREHTVLLILAHFARYAARAKQAGKKQLASFLPVSAIVATLIRLTDEGGLLAGRWPYPTYTDVYRCVNKLRSRLLKAGFNSNFIESNRGAGYRISTPVTNLILGGSQEASEKFWATLLDSALSAPQDIHGRRSNEESPRG
jgi:hypothetical protein